MYKRQEEEYLDILDTLPKENQYLEDTDPNKFIAKMGACLLYTSNEVIIDRETVIEEDHIDEIIDSGVQNILVHKEEANSSDYSIIFNTLQKDPSNSEKEAVRCV